MIRVVELTDDSLDLGHVGAGSGLLAEFGSRPSRVVPFAQPADATSATATISTRAAERIEVRIPRSPASKGLMMTDTRRPAHRRSALSRGAVSPPPGTKWATPQQIDRNAFQSATIHAARNHTWAYDISNGRVSRTTVSGTMTEARPHEQRIAGIDDVDNARPLAVTATGVTHIRTEARPNSTVSTHRTPPQNDRLNATCKHTDRHICARVAQGTNASSGTVA